MSANPQSVVRGGPEPVHVDGEAEAAIEPGQLLDYGTDAESFVTHGVDGVAAQPHFAETKEWGGDLESSTDSYDDAYASGDYIRTKVCQRGTRVQVQVAAGESVSVGDYLVSNGDGNLRVAALTGTSPDDDGAVIARAREAGSETTSFHINAEIC